MDRIWSTPNYQREHVCGPVLDGMRKFVVVKADMSQIDFQEVLFKQEICSQFIAGMTKIRET